MLAFWTNLPFLLIFLIAGIAVLYYLRNAHKEKIELIKKGEGLVNQDALRRWHTSQFLYYFSA